MNSDSCQAQGWDCDPFAIVHVDYVDDDLDLEASYTDWQVLALDRFGDRNVNAKGNW